MVRAVTVTRLFEPTDLEFEDPGVTELDMQFGPVRGQNSYRISMADFEFDLGLTETVELDLDGEFAVGGPGDGSFTINQLAQDNLWSSLKIGLGTFEDKTEERELALGLQLGPIWPIAPQAQGVGVEGLALIGLRVQENYFALNLGGVNQPTGGPGQGKPAGFLAGINIEMALDEKGVWAALAQASGVEYWTSDPDQITTEIGIQWSPYDNLDLSIVGLRGWLRGGDQWGILFGISPKFKLW